jgi:hypothetical protein
MVEIVSCSTHETMPIPNIETKRKIMNESNLIMRSE